MNLADFKLRHGVTVAKRGDKWGWELGRHGFDKPEHAAQNFLVWKQGIEDAAADERERQNAATLGRLLGLR